MVSNPGLLLMLGAALVPLFRGWARGVWMIVLPLAGLALLWTLPEGTGGGFEAFGLALEPLRVDALSRVFATAFLIAALTCVVYALHDRDVTQHVGMLFYAGATVGGVLAGDLLTLFVFWELVGLSSVSLVWARRTQRGYRAGVRYLVAQVISGLLLLGGIAVHVQAGRGIEFDYIGLTGVGGVLIFVGIGVKCGFPVLHAWLQDTYPEASIVGTVVLSVFTTKFAVYTLARGYPGVDALVWIGAVMACFPIFYAVIENDLRRVLSYSLINQLGFMVAGIGMGGELGINGATAHAFAHILYKSLLFMSMGAVLLRTRTVNGSDLGGLYKSMPQTAVFCVIGAASISAFPLFSGFVTKSMAMDAVAQDGRAVIWLLLLFASAGVFHHAGIKVPFFAFFAHDRGHRVAEAPVNMRVAMGLTAGISVVIGLVPGWLYAILPYPVDYTAYTVPHVVNQVQLLVLASMAFTVLMRTGLYPPELRSVNLDFDAVYRRVLPRAWRGVLQGAEQARGALEPQLRSRVERALPAVTAPLRDRGRLAVPWSTGAMVWWVALLLGAFLLLSIL